MPPIWKKKGLWVLLLSFVVVAWVAHTAYRALAPDPASDQYQSLAEGDTFPASMPLKTDQGKFVSFADYKGKVVLINFWAAWCGPCLTEMPALYQLHRRLEAKGFTILGVSMDDDLGQGVAALTRVAGAPPFPMFRGPEQAIAARFPMEGLPFTVVVDRQGVIRYAKAGELDWTSKEAMSFVEGML